jgi:arsenical pump membrane protein
LSSSSPLHPRALLIGLDLGPNLVVTGSLSAIFWLQVAKREGASPSVRTYSAVGIVLVPLSIMAALLVSGLVSPGNL